MMTPKVSVVMATYRRDETLKKALLSLAEQTYSNYEIILVNDNGDEEWNRKVNGIVEQFKEKYPAIVFQYIVNDPNRGSAETRNIGIQAADGEYVTFLDDDDIYLPDKIATQVAGMIDTKADYSITDLLLYTEKDKLVDKRIRRYILKYDVNSLLEYHLKYHMAGTDTFMFRKEYLLSIGGFDAMDVGDEFYLMQKAIVAGGKLYYQPECYVKAYIHVGEGNLSSGDGKIEGENALYAYKKTFFDQVDSKTKRYINMRHYAVIAFAEVRRKRILSFLKNAIQSFCCAPIACVKMFFFER